MHQFERNTHFIENEAIIRPFFNYTERKKVLFGRKFVRVF